MKKLMLMLAMTLALTLTANMAKADASWKAHTNTDEMNGETTTTLFLKGAATKKLDFPYSNPDVLLAYSCSGGYFAFLTSANNIVGGDNEDGYELHRFRVKIDDELVKFTFSQEWGSEWFRDYNRISYDTRKIKQSNRLLIETSLFGQGTVIYAFNTTGFDESLCR
jgi:hypothetical protein